MPFNAAQRQKVLDWLSIKCPGFRCPACGASDWSACGLVDGDVPLVGIGCNQCGFLALFSAEVVGVERE
jgi:hypothetical protein